MAHTHCSFRSCRFAGMPLKDHVVADDLRGRGRPSSPRRFTHFGTGIALLLGLVLATSAAIAQDEKDAKPDATALPPGYKPPPDPPEIMLIELPLLDDAERESIRKTLNRSYSTPLRNGDFRSDKARANIRKGIQYRLNEIAIASQRSAPPEVRKKLADLRKRLTGNGGDVSQAARLVARPEDALRVRREFLQMLVQETEKLFENNYYARVQAALILGELNEVEEDAGNDVKAVAYAPAAKALTKVILDPQQPDGVKIVCVLGLIRILRFGNPNVEQKRDIGLAIVSELKRTDTNPWYQARLAKALGYNDVALDLDRQPFIFNALMAVVNDKDGKRDLPTRTQAAWSLGRIPLDRTMDISKLTIDIAALGQELASAQADAPKNPGWKRCAWLLYLAFERESDNDLDAKRERKGGLLNNPMTKADADEAFKVVLPVVREIIANKTAAPEQLQDLAKWLQGKGFRPRIATPGAGDSKSKE